MSYIRSCPPTVIPDISKCPQAVIPVSSNCTQSVIQDTKSVQETTKVSSDKTMLVKNELEQAQFIRICDNTGRSHKNIDQLPCDPLHGVPGITRPVGPHDMHSDVTATDGGDATSGDPDNRLLRQANSMAALHSTGTQCISGPENENITRCNTDPRQIYKVGICIVWTFSQIHSILLCWSHVMFRYVMELCFILCFMTDSISDVDEETCR